MKNEIVIQLSEAEIWQGVYGGAEYQIRSLRPGRKGHKWGMTEQNAWHQHIESALSELAFAKWRGEYWSVTPLEDRDKGDVGLREVRETFYSTGRLITHPEDKDDREYWLLTGNMGRYIIRGWLYGREAKEPANWQDPTHKERWAFFTPQSQLRPPEVQVD